MSTPDQPYDIHLDDKFGQLTLIDVDAEAAAHQPWFNQTLTRVNDVVVRLGVLEGDFHWHKHDLEDEFFLVLDGELVIEIDGAETVRAATPSGLHSSARGNAQDECTTAHRRRDGRSCRRRSHW